ncbi:phosphatidylinositol 4-OH kinase beta1 [Actinidia rufa]|uniref:1-phosphatidylinositol 4-kinase n=1 Tax=Actinidia rufa TaxID=165716 RepID=A0A7J0F065_9ERIC|nr:phosphatidylinositol 4-OH kinase beta1 [Actinidia rufa]
MVRLLGLPRFESEPREITRTNPTGDSSGGDNGWLIRFFDSAFFCEWIAVSYLYKHEHSGVRDYLCNRMYTLPLSGIESYLFQICYMLVHKPSPSLDKFVIDVCSKSLKIALKVHCFLLAELEDSDDNEGISRIQEKCQIAATLMGEWPPLIRPPNAPPSPVSKNQVLNKLLSSKQRLLSLTSSPPTQRSVSFSPSPGNSLQDDGGRASPEENKIFKKFIPSPKVRDSLFFRKSVDRDEEDSEKDGFFRRLLRDSRDEDGRKSMEKHDEDSEKDGFFKRLLRDSRDEDARKSMEKREQDTDKDSFFKRLLRDSRDEDDRKSMEKHEEDTDKDGFLKRLLRDSRDEDEELTSSSDGFFKRLFRDNKSDAEEKVVSKMTEEDEKEGLQKMMTKKDSFGNFLRISLRTRKMGMIGPMTKARGKPMLRKKNLQIFLCFVDCFVCIQKMQRLQLLMKTATVYTFLKAVQGQKTFSASCLEIAIVLWKTRSFFGLNRQKEKRPGSPKQRNEKSNAKPPLQNNAVSQFRKGTYHESLDFVHSLCETSYGLVDVFPIEDRKSALRESLADINAHVATAQDSGGVCFPMGKGMYRVVNIPEDEAVLLNSREKAPYLICVEVLKSETPSNAKDASNTQKLSKGGIPLANGDALLPKPPPWAYPLWTAHDMYHSGYDRMSRSTSQAIDQAMSQMWDAKVKFVHASLYVEKQSPCQAKRMEMPNSNCGIDCCGLEPASGPLEVLCSGCRGKGICHASKEHGSDLEWVRIVLTADPGVNMDDIVDQEPPRRKEHRRVPSTVAIEEVKAATLKGEAPPGLPLKGAGQDSSDTQPTVMSGGVPKAGDALSGELWEVKKERIQNSSVHGKLPGWDLRSVIVKSGDDCRQEHLAVQLISHFYDIFQEAGIPLWLRPYEVLVTSSYTALIETIPDTASLHSIKSRFPNITSLRDFFVAKYEENSPSFKLAQVKDRHNGNLLLDEEGHIIHIDFGFMLSNSPGGVNFESAPFKLTRELLEVMDSDAEGIPSEFFDYFKVLCIQGFLTCRKHAERVILLVEMLQVAEMESLNSVLFGYEVAFLLSKDGVLMLKAYERRKRIDQNYWSENGREIGMFLRMAMARGVLWKGTRGTKVINWQQGYRFYGDLSNVVARKLKHLKKDLKIRNWEKFKRRQSWRRSKRPVAWGGGDRNRMFLHRNNAHQRLGFGHHQGRHDGFTLNFQDHGTFEKASMLLRVQRRAGGIKESLGCIFVMSELVSLDSGFPCFKGGPRTIQNLRKRFHLSLTEEQCVSLVLSLISSSLDAWRTRQYDYYQRVLNGIL